MGELFEYKSQSALLETVIGETASLNHREITQNPELYTKQLRNRERFWHLPEEKRMLVLEQYRMLKAKLEKPFISKFKAGLMKLLFGQPTFQMAWLCLALVVPLMLLLKVEGGRQAAWLLPLVAAIYGLDNYFFASAPLKSFDAHLYPSEQTIVEKYMNEPLSKNIFEQQTQLKKGWQNYLIERWKAEPASTDPAIFQNQVEEADYAFQLARVKALGLSEKRNVPSTEPVIFLLCYFGWNLFFATAVHRTLIKKFA